MEAMAHRVLTHGVKQSFSLDEKANLPFNAITLHDGSSFAIHNGLKKHAPGRFSHTRPVAVECHVTMDLRNNSIDMFTVAPDSNSEHLYAPDAASLEGGLLRADAGYFSLRYREEIDAANGHFILRMGLQMNPKVRSWERPTRSWILRGGSPLTVNCSVRTVSISDAHGGNEVRNARK